MNAVEDDTLERLPHQLQMVALLCLLAAAILYLYSGDVLNALETLARKEVKADA